MLTVQCLTCVNERVLFHVGLLVKPLSAILARIRPRVRVDEQMSGQCGGALETFAADFTAKTPLLKKKGNLHQSKS